MGEGTRLGEFTDSSEFNQTHAQEELAGVNAKESSGTKLGELSEFELSLLPSEEREAAKKSAVAMDDASLFESLLDSGVADYSEGDVITGVVRSIEKAGVLVDIGYKSDGFILNGEFSMSPDETPASTVKPGDEIQALILKLETKDGYTMLSRKRADFILAWNYLTSIAKSRTVLDVSIKSRVEGGVVAEYNGVKGFIPGSHILTGPQDQLDNYVGQSAQVVVLQADRKRKKVIFSAKMARSKGSRGDSSKFLELLEVGQTREGKVSSIKDFGVFVDLGGVEGLVHISELSWSRVAHPSDILAVGQAVNVFILGVDRENGRISLGMKQLQADPWVSVSERYSVGQVVKGTVTRTTTFGAFVQLEPALEGLVHISELSKSHVKQVEDVVKPGETIQAKVIKVMPDEQRIGLSIKALESDSDDNGSSDASNASEESLLEVSAD